MHRMHVLLGERERRAYLTTNAHAHTYTHTYIYICLDHTCTKKDCVGMGRIAISTYAGLYIA